MPKPRVAGIGKIRMPNFEKKPKLPRLHHQRLMPSLMKNTGTGIMKGLKQKPLLRMK